ncbi:TolC family outer membrane protein [Paremcibacter congregatus]|uniref:TolC family outer membrane protein n=1 Tax=Paremcibacter congregatus TaxID=2043170 RepID=UPI0030EFA063
MKTKLYLSLLPIVTSLALPGVAQGETLKEAMAKAYLNNPTLLAERASLRAVDETINQAKAGWRPSVAATGNYGYRNTKSQQTFSTSGDTNPRSLGLEVRQSVFSSMKTVNGTSEARNQVKAAREQLTSVEQQVLLDSVTAYMNVLTDMSVLQLTQNNVAVLQRQLEASEDRFRVGEITRTDVAQSKARLSRAVSEEIRAEAALSASRAAYRKTVGGMPANLKIPEGLPAMPASEEAALAFAMENNPQLLGARYTEKAARYNVKKQYGGLGPSVDIVARYSKSWENFSTTDTSTTKEVLAQMTMPLYQSGAVSSQIRQSRQIENQRRLQALSAERIVAELIRNSWEGYREATARISASEDQVTANDIALEGVRQEAEVGSRTTLNVLDAEQELLDSQVSLVRARRDQFIAAYVLLSSMGKLTADNLDLNIATYNPEDHTDKVENKFFGWGIDKD